MQKISKYHYTWRTFQDDVLNKKINLLGKLLVSKYSEILNPKQKQFDKTLR